MSSEKHFLPPFCPNNSCIYYKSSTDQRKDGFFIKRGTKLRQDGTWIIRFQCKGCQKSFSDSSFHINYRLKKRGHINVRVFMGVVHNRSNRSMARELGVSESTIRDRVLRLSRLALLKHHSFLQKIKIKEDLAYDGLEAFAGSQYEPNNVNQMIGVDSLFGYLFNFAPMNRKGRMSDRQRKYLFKKEEVEGRFDPKAIRVATAEIFEEILRYKCPSRSQLRLKSDEHFQYRRALRRDLHKDLRAQIVHETVSSKATRNYKNILFSVNHMDLLIRRKVAAFSRETICFSKKPSRMVHKYVLYLCYKNYMKPQFVKEHKKDARSHTHSPAMILGLTTKLLRFHELFNEYEPYPITEDLPLDWKELYEDRVRFRRSHRFIKGQKNTKAAA